MSLIKGVLLAGKFRTHDQLRGMSREDWRNTLIVVLTDLSNQSNYQSFDDDSLAGMGAVMVFLREGRIRDDAALKTMSADDQRNTMIVEMDAQTGAGVTRLQGLSNVDLVRVGLGSDVATPGTNSGVVSSFIRGVLLAGRFRTQHELNRMPIEDQRNTLIVELTAHSNQSNYQSFNNAVLEGMGAVMVYLRGAGIRSDADLQRMSADDQRNTLIAALGAHTHLGRELQRLNNLELVVLGLGDNEAIAGESDGMHAVIGLTHSRFAGVLGISDGGGIGVQGRGGRLAALFEGDVEVTGDIRLANADCAEDFPVGDALDVEPGTVMVLDADGTVRPSARALDTRVAGVVSGAGAYKPALVLDRQAGDQHRQPIALMGKVFCKVDATFGAIAVGDLLTSSPTPGHAMRASDPRQAVGALLGKALSPLASGRGLIPILVTLH
jgi:hypothetical protein